MKKAPTAVLLVLLSPKGALAVSDAYPGGMPATASRDVPGLSRVLSEGDWNARIHAVHALGAAGTEAQAPLERAALDADWQVRFTAVHWLGRRGKTSIPALKRALLEDPCRVVRISAVHWLGSFGPEAAPAVREGVDAQDDGTRLAGWYWLRKNEALDAPDDPPYRGPDAKERDVCLFAQWPLLSGGKETPPAASPDERPARTAAAPVDQEATGESPEEEIARLALRRREKPLDPAARFAALEDLLADLPDTAPAEPSPREPPKPELDVPEDRHAPESALPLPAGFPAAGAQPSRTTALLAEDHGGPPHHDPLPALLGLLEGGSSRKRARAADELGALGAGAGRAVPLLIRRLSDRSPRVRASCAVALGKVGRSAEAAVPPLIRALRDKHPDVRYGAAEALARIGTPAAEKAFRGYLREELRRSMRRASP